eukprot:31160-Pelagococcus_subviridis.AAC.11
MEVPHLVVQPVPRHAHNLLRLPTERIVEDAHDLAVLALGLAPDVLRRQPRLLLESRRHRVVALALRRRRARGDAHAGGGEIHRLGERVLAADGDLPR